MIKVTTSDIYRIVSGDSIKIAFPYPLNDRGENPEWYMAQPTDWLYDMGLAVGEAAEAELCEQPHMVQARTLPPSPGWIKRQEVSLKAVRDRIAELEAKGKAILPEESIALDMLRDRLGRLFRPENYTRAEELAAQVNRDARNNYWMQRLVVDGEGKPLFDPATPEGQDRWNRLGRKAKKELLIPLSDALSLVDIAKN